MTVIYQPKGRALEYSPLALNLYKGCSHGCIYCFAPSASFCQREDFHGNVTPRENILQRVEQAAKKLVSDKREILLSFTSDVYQPLEANLEITRQALQVLKNYDLRPTVLTKGGALARRDFDILSSIKDAAFAVTLTTDNEAESLFWEPGAALPCERIENLRLAHEAGIKTWISCEPVINPAAVYRLIEETASFTDLYKIGKLNYHPHAKKIDWPEFREKSIKLLKSLDKPFLIKKDLLAA